MAAIYWMNHKGNLDCEVVVQRTIQADRRDAAGSVSDHHNKADTEIKQITWIFCFPSAYKGYVYPVL